MPTVDLDQVAARVRTDLPQRARWFVSGSPLDFDFTRAAQPLSCVTGAEVNDPVNFRPEWTHLFPFGEQNYAKGGGASNLLVVSEKSGEVLGLDFERTNAVFFLNSDLDCLIGTFNLFDRALRMGTLPSEGLVRSLARLDPSGFGKSDWALLAETIGENL